MVCDEVDRSNSAATELAQMTYYIAKTVPLSFSDAVARVEAVLKDEGFGIISRVDIQAALKEKIGVEFRPYLLLGACNPRLAYEALQLQNKVGPIMPCKVVVQPHEPQPTNL